MSSNSCLWLLLPIAAVCCAGAGPDTTATCPSSLPDRASHHSLNNASLFDGPPSEMADLIPVPAGTMDRWSLDHVDPWLVCKFAGTTRTVTFHAPGATDCEAGGNPFHAFCR